MSAAKHRDGITTGVFLWRISIDQHIRQFRSELDFKLLSIVFLGSDSGRGGDEQKCISTMTSHSRWNDQWVQIAWQEHTQTVLRKNSIWFHKWQSCWPLVHRICKDKSSTQVGIPLLLTNLWTKINIQSSFQEIFGGLKLSILEYELCPTLHSRSNSSRLILRFWWILHTCLTSKVEKSNC